MNTGLNQTTVCHDIFYNTSPATYEAMHARYRMPLKRMRIDSDSNLLHQAIVDQRIAHQNLSYVAAVLVASGRYVMDEEACKLATTHRHHAHLMFDYIGKLATHLQTSDTIKRAVTLSANGLVKLEQEQKVMRKFPAISSSSQPPTHYLLVLGCSDEAIDRLSKLFGDELRHGVPLDIVRTFTVSVGDPRDTKTERHYIYAVCGGQSQQYLVERAPLYYC